MISSRWKGTCCAGPVKILEALQFNSSEMGNQCRCTEVGTTLRWGRGVLRNVGNKETS